MPPFPLALFDAAVTARNTDFTARHGIGDPVWVADGSEASIWKRLRGSDAEWGVNLKLADAVPPVIRVVASGPNTQSARNEARNQAIRVRDRLAGGG